MLKSEGYEVCVVVYHDIPFYKPLLDEQGVETIYRPESTSKRKRISTIHQCIREFAPDVVIAYLDSPAIIACLCKRWGKHSFRLIVSERNTTQSLTWKERCKFRLYRYADKVVCNSFTQGEFVKKHFPRLALKVEVITNFLDIERFSPGVEPQGANQQSCRMVCVGRVAPQKNVLRFIEAIALVQKKHRVQVDWYGDRWEQYYAQCKERVKDLGLEQSFKFHHPESQIEAVYRTADFFCLPSIYEGFPNVLCEAMGCGLPVLCSNVCDNPRIVKEGVTGLLFNPYKVEDMVQTIERFFALSQEQRAILGQNARRWVEANMSPATFVEQYMQIL